MTEIRDYGPADAAETARLFYDTVHAVDAADYTAEQLAAWAPEVPDTAGWNASFSARCALVAVLDGRIVGFGDMTDDGYLDRLYVHRDFLRRGVATALCDRLEAHAKGCAITVRASVTALPFFRGRGYATVARQQVERRGVLLTNYLMRKRPVP